MPTETFTADDSWTVPDSVLTVTVTLKGAQAKYGVTQYDTDYYDENVSGDIGLGGTVKGELSVSPGQTLYIRRTEGGERGTGSDYNGGKGGDAIDIRQAGTALSDRVTVAGGGGGPGVVSDTYYDPIAHGGHGGGDVGEDGYIGDSTNSDSNGKGGSQTSPGEGGINGNNSNRDGGSGTGPNGGDGATDVANAGGGGGGSGYYGGGAGANGNGSGSGGGGGSSYTDGLMTVTENSKGTSTRTDPLVEISYVVAPQPPTNVTAQVDADDQITLSWDTNTNGGDPDDFDVEINRDGSGWVSPSGGPSNVSADGSGSYSVTYNPGSDNSYDSQVGIDSSFQFRVRANNDGGSTDWTSSNTVKTHPLPPHNPSVSRPNVNTFKIHGTVQSNISSKIRVQMREDTGSGYGSWQDFDLVADGDTTQLTSGSVSTKGDSFTFTYETNTDYPGYSGTQLKEDARYQFRLGTWNDPNGTDKKLSKWVYTDYGNQDNVYFEDDFESGDLAGWSTTNLSGESGVKQGTFADNDPSYDQGVTNPDQGSYWLFLESDSAVIKQLGDLSGESDVIVKAAVSTGSMDSSAEHTSIDWYDGSSWTSLREFYWEYNKQGWVEITARVDSSLLSTDNRVRFNGYGGTGDYFAVDRVIVSDILHEYTQPAIPSNLSLDTSSDREITASWTNNASFWTAFDTNYQRTSDSSWTDHDNVKGTLTTIGGLLDGEEYGVQTRVFQNQPRHGIVAKNYTSPYISATSVTNLPAPTGLTADAVGTSTVDLSWAAAHNYGQTEIQYKESDVGSWNTFSTISPGTEAETLTGLLNGEQYDARVVATTEHTSTEDQ